MWPTQTSLLCESNNVICCISLFAVAKLSEICDRAHRCQSAQRQAFNLLICAAQRNRKDGNHPNLNLLTREGALTR